MSRRPSNIGTAVFALVLFAIVIAVIAALVVLTGRDDDGDTQGAHTSINCDPLAEIDRYRYHSIASFDLAARPPDAEPETPDRGPGATKFTWDFDGAVQKPDKIEAQVTFPDGGGAGPLSVIVIGNKEFNLVGGAWQTSENAGTELWPPLKLCQALAPDADLASRPGEPSRTYDVPTLHYHFDDLPSDFMKAWGKDSDFRIIDRVTVDVWISQRDGFPVVLDVEGTGTYANGRTLTSRLVSEVRDFGDDNINIDAPEEPPTPPPE